jgi:cyclopropane-fatty-acyl-phospholipid synthase
MNSQLNSQPSLKNNIPRAHHVRKPPVAARTLLRVLRKLHYGTLTFTAPDGTVTVFKGQHAGADADMRFADWRVASDIVKAAEIGLAECYRDGRMFTSNLTQLLTLCVENEAALMEVFYGNKIIATFFRLKHWLRSNNRSQAKRNISAHYDLSNAFYQRWLDKTMTYSSAVGTASETSMEAAQIAKYERILAQLNPPKGASILEIGAGWGGFAEHAARTRGVKVHGITLSTEQLNFAVSRIADAGLSDLASFELIDYRDVTATYDFVVSIEMFEAVGEKFWPVYFKAVHDRLNPSGRAMIQAITMDEKAFARYRVSSDFIREYIFPGGMLAPVSRFITEAQAQGLTAQTPFMFGIDYANTLKYWLTRVNAEQTEINKLGFDEKFLQIWRFYLCYCEAGFRTKRTDVMQIELARKA